MRKAITNLLCLFIPSKHARRHVRSWLMEYNPALDQKYLSEFLDEPVPEKCVLLVEPSITHGELAPGFAKYWLDLGFHVHALLHHKVADDDPFCRFSHPRLRIFRHSYCCYERLLTSAKINDYQMLFFTTPAYARWTKNDQKYALHDCLRFCNEMADRTFLVEHRLDDIAPYGEEGFLHNGRVVTLADFAWKGQPTVMVNPHYFGDVRVTGKNELVHFIVVGALDEKRKNHNLLLQAAGELLDNGTDNFHITVIGAGKAKRSKLTQKIPDRLLPHFTFKGWVKFSQLYEYMEEADFFLPLLDPLNESHERYLTTGISGSYQLILGFRKPCLIHDKFAAFHSLTQDNCIVYDDLGKAMQQAVALPAEHYASLQQGLEKLSARVYRQSLDNLAAALKSHSERS